MPRRSRSDWFSALGTSPAESRRISLINTTVIIVIPIKLPLMTTRLRTYPASTHCGAIRARQWWAYVICISRLQWYLLFDLQLKTGYRFPMKVHFFWPCFWLEANRAQARLEGHSLLSVVSCGLASPSSNKTLFRGRAWMLPWFINGFWARSRPETRTMVRKENSQKKSLFVVKYS